MANGTALLEQSKQGVRLDAGLTAPATTDVSVVNSQKNRLLVEQFKNDFTRQHGLDASASSKLAEIYQGMLDSIVANRNQSPSVASKFLTEQFNLLAKNEGREKLLYHLDNFHRLTHGECDAVRSPQELRSLRQDIAVDLLYEIADPSLRISQGQAKSCAVVAREFMKGDMVQYSEFIADLVTKGYGHSAKSESGAKVGFYAYKTGDFNLTELEGRSFGNAIYQSVVHKHWGPMYADTVERFMEARGQYVRIRTADQDVSNSPEDINLVGNDILDHFQAQKKGLVSLRFADTGQAHAKHILELCPCDPKEMPEGYDIKLSNPWDPNEPLPARYQEFVKDNHDGTFFIKLEDLKRELCFAALETGNPDDFGKTENIKDNSPVISHFGFGIPPFMDFMDFSKEKKDKSASREDRSANKKGGETAKAGASIQSSREATDSIGKEFIENGGSITSSAFKSGI